MSAHDGSGAPLSRRALREAAAAGGESAAEPAAQSPSTASPAPDEDTGPADSPGRPTRPRITAGRPVRGRERTSWGEAIQFAFTTVATAWAAAVLMSLVLGLDAAGVQRTMTLGALVGVQALALILPVGRRAARSTMLVLGALAAVVIAAALTALELSLMLGVSPVMPLLMLGLLAAALAAPAWTAAGALLAAAILARTPSRRLRIAGAVLVGVGALLAAGGVALDLTAQASGSALAQDEGVRILVIHGLAVAAIGGGLLLLGSARRR
ncbi:hypothetical protein [Microbacterium sp. NPDC096154]|uniref:hypothetical protein n=1 Tax=Microbacterium sp. NPDC096154 TaxID=3155549 RepID=UPI00332D7709